MYIATGAVTEQNVCEFFQLVLQEYISLIVTIETKNDQSENVRNVLMQLVNNSNFNVVKGTTAFLEYAPTF
jgi:hypothetical protein